VSKGVGYVSFAIKEDAESSFAKIAEEGITLVGRKLRVQWAESKVFFCLFLIVILLLITSYSLKNLEKWVMPQQ